MKMNLRLVRTSQFFQQFKLDVQYKPGKKQIIPDAFSRLTNTNIVCVDSSYSEFDALFTYNTTPVEMVSRILAGYRDDKYWTCHHCQIQVNENLGDNKALLYFVIRCSYRSDSDPYMSPRPKNSIKPLSGTVLPRSKGATILSPGFREATPGLEDFTVVIGDSMLLLPNKTKQLYYVKKTTGNLRLCIPPVVALDVSQIAYGKNHSGFSYYYRIVTRSGYILSLIRLLRKFIQHYTQYLQLQIRRHRPYEFL